MRSSEREGGRDSLVYRLMHKAEKNGVISKSNCTCAGIGACTYNQIKRAKSHAIDAFLSHRL